jgi:pyridoxine 5'-phosphate synthase PdxJ
VSIGHALITESLYNGLNSTIKSYLQILKWKSFIQI